MVLTHFVFSLGFVLRQDRFDLTQTAFSVCARFFVNVEKPATNSHAQLNSTHQRGGG